MNMRVAAAAVDIKPSAKTATICNFLHAEKFIFQIMNKGAMSIKTSRNRSEKQSATFAPPVSPQNCLMVFTVVQYAQGLEPH